MKIPLDDASEAFYNVLDMALLLNTCPARPALVEREREGEVCLRGDN